MSATIDLQRADKLDLENREHQFELAKMVDDAYKGSQPYMQDLAWLWERNIRFFLGDQHLYFNETKRRYEPIPRTKYNQYIPRPVTNYCLPIIQTLVSLFSRQRPNVTNTPNSTDLRDVSMAKLAEVIKDAKWEEDEEDLKHTYAALILCLTGTVFRKTYWDNNKGSEFPVIDEDGNEVLIKPGDVAVEMVDPFRIIPDLQTGSWFIEANIKPLSWIYGQYDSSEGGYTGLAKEVKHDDSLSTVMELRNRLKTASGFSDSDSSEALKLDSAAVLKECCIEPTENHPEGIFIVTAGGKPLYVGKAPYYDAEDEDSWHPYDVCKYQEVFFRYHGKAPMDDLASLQKRINSIDAIIELTAKTMAIPQWLIPNSTGIQEGYITGQPGLMIFYNGGVQGAYPQKVEGSGVNPQLFKEREIKVDAMHQIAGSNEVLSGMRPEGVSTASGYGMLLEQSFSKFRPIIVGWEKFIERGQTRKLRLISQRYREPRPEFIQRLKSMNRDNLDVEIAAFLGEDIKDNINIRVESGSTLPKSPMIQQETYKQLAQAGYLGPLDPNSNPVGNREFLSKFGVKQIPNQINADLEKAKHVNQILTAVNRDELGEEFIPPIRPEMDNLDVHLKVLTDQMKKPDFVDKYEVFESRFKELNSLQQQQQVLASQPLPMSLPQDQGQPVGP